MDSTDAAYLTHSIYFNDYVQEAGTLLTDITHNCREVFWGLTKSWQLIASAPNALVASILPAIANGADDVKWLDPSWAEARARQPIIHAYWTITITGLHKDGHYDSNTTNLVTQNVTV